MELSSENECGLPKVAINNEYIMNNDKTTISNLANSRKFYSYANLIEAKSTTNNQQNGKSANQITRSNSKPYVLNNSIIQYYDEKPTLLSSQSSYYLSSFQDEEDSSSEDDSSNEQITSILEHRSLKSTFELNNLYKNNQQPQSFNDKSSVNKSTNNNKDNSNNSKDVSSELNENIKNLSQFLIKSRSRSSSPRASFKNRKSFNQKHNNRVQPQFTANPNDIILSTSSNKSTIPSTTAINGQEDQFYLLNNQILSNKVAEPYIKENYGLRSTNELKNTSKDGSTNEEEPIFNAFDLKSLRYSFNKVLKRRGGLWSSQALSPTNTPDYPSNNRNDKSSIDLHKLHIHHNNNNNFQIVNSKRKNMNRDTKLMDLVADNQKVYWCEVPIVVESGILNELDSKQRQLQEAHFELIASEASYLRSLNVLIKNFYMNTFFCDTNIIDAHKKEDLFSNIVEVVKVSTNLFKELELRWLENVYMKYCRFKKRQERTLRQLQDKPKFNGILRLLESDSKCQSLSLNSFLLLPVQRITRYPLLVEAILNRTDPQSDTYQLTQDCLRTCNEIVLLCNAAAKQYEEYENLIPKLKFTNIKCFPMLSTPRWLINICDTVKIKQEIQSTTIIGSFRHPNLTKTNVCIILLSDLIVIAKKKSDDVFIVIDFCNRNSIEIYDLHPIDENRISVNAKMWDNFKHLIKLVFLCNYANKKVDFYLNFSSEMEKANWLTLALKTEKRKSNKKQKDMLDTFKLKYFQMQNTAAQDYSNGSIDSSGQKTVNVMKQQSFNQSNESNESKDSQELSDAELSNEIFI